MSMFDAAYEKFHGTVQAAVRSETGQRLLHQLTDGAAAARTCNDPIGAGLYGIDGAERKRVRECLDRLSKEKTHDIKH